MRRCSRTGERSRRSPASAAVACGRNDTPEAPFGALFNPRSSGVAALAARDAPLSARIPLLRALISPRRESLVHGLVAARYRDDAHGPAYRALWLRGSAVFLSDDALHPDANAERLAELLHRRGGQAPLRRPQHGRPGGARSRATVPQACRGRIVMVGTPYGDCFAARRFDRWPGGHAILGRSMEEWLRRRDRLPPENCEIGVIAGTGGEGLGRLVAPDLPPPNDGVVALSETIVPGMRDTSPSGESYRDAPVGHRGASDLHFSGTGTIRSHRRCPSVN